MNYKRKGNKIVSIKKTGRPQYKKILENQMRSNELLLTELNELRESVKETDLLNKDLHKSLMKAREDATRYRNDLIEGPNHKIDDNILKAVNEVNKKNPVQGAEHRWHEIPADRTYAMDEDIKNTVFFGGAIRKVIKECSHMICPELMRRVGLIYSEGLESYRDKTVNYAEITTARFGLPLDNLLRHLDNHYLRYRGGDTSEDNLAKLGWAIQQIMHQENPGCQHYNLLLKPEDRIAKENTLYIG